MNSSPAPLKLRTVLLVLSLTGMISGMTLQVAGQTQTQQFTSNGTFTVPAGVTSVKVECWGGGGAGGGNSSNRSRGSGGGAGGAYAIKVVSVTPGNSYTVNVATAVSGSKSDGSPGHPSWFGTVSTVYAEGGAGGSASNGGTSYGGIGSSDSSIGDVVYPGGNGGDGTSSSSGGGGGGAGSSGKGGNASGTTAGSGTAIDGGDGGTGKTAESNGSAGNIYGGGGSGAYIPDNTDHTGGAGAGGKVVVTWTTPLYYRSKQTGAWNLSSSWQSSPNGSTWSNATAYPDANALGITIQTGHTITFNVDISVDQVVINNGGALVINSGNTLTLNDGAGDDLTNNGTMTVNGTVSNGGTLVNNSTLTFNSTGTYIHNQDGGFLPAATWNAASTCMISGLTSTVPTLTSFEQSFGNFIWGCNGQTADISLAAHLTSIAGDLTLTSTGSGSLRLVDGANGNALTINVYGNLVQSGGTLYLHGTGTLGSGGSLAVTVSGGLTLSGGTLNLNGCSDSQSTGVDFNLKGNLTLAGGTLTKTGSSYGTHRFSGTSTQYFARSGGAISGNPDFVILSGATVDFGTSVLDGSNATFTLNGGGTIITANAGTNGALTTSGSDGSIQVGGTRVFSSGANYVFDGASAQIAGNALSQNSPVNNLTINNSHGVTLSASATVTGTLTLTSGQLVTGANLLSVTNSATGAISGGGSSSWVNGNLQRSIAAGANTYGYPIGTASAYTPVSLAFQAGTAAGTLTGMSSDGDLAAIGSSTIDPSISVNRNWTFTVNSGLATVSCNATFTFLPGDIDAGASYSNFIIGEYQGSAWNYPSVGAKTPTSTQATGLTAFGSFQIGEYNSTNIPCAYDANGNSPAISDVMPCVNMPSNPLTITSSFACHQYFTMNVIKGLTYEVYTCNGSAPSSPLKLTVYQEGAPSDPPIALSTANTGNPCTSVSNNVYVTFTPTFSGQVRVLVNSKTDCSSTTPSGLTVIVNISGGSNSLDDEASSGSDAWIGHLYDGTNFTNFLGYYNVGAETFREGFGTTGTWPGYASDDNSCFNVFSGGYERALFKLVTFSVHYRMTSSRHGLYTADLTGDDGTRLSVDGVQVYSDWSDHSPRTNLSVLFSLSGNSSLVFDYYENAGQNVAGFDNLKEVFTNELTSNTSQVVCQGSSASAISGNEIGKLPTGISLSNTGYQWTYSTSLTGTRTTLSGATGPTFTPDVSSAPFNNSGTYYIFRNAILVSTNNTGFGNYTATNESNAAVLVVNTILSAAVSYTGTPFCKSINTVQPVTQTGTSGGTFTASPSGLSLDPSTGDILPSASQPGTYTVTYTVESAGCGTYATTTQLTIIGDAIWTGDLNTDWNTAGNWYCHVVPDLTTNVHIPVVVNQPILSTGAAGMVNDLLIDNGSSITVTANTLRIAGAVTSTAGLDAQSGSISMEGSAAQSIGDGIFASNTVMDLTVINANGVTLQGPLNLTGILKAQTGNLVSGGYLTLVSTAARTALIDGGGSGSVTGQVTMQRYLPSALGYKYFSSPFSAATVGEFSDDLDLNAAFPTFYKYDENNQSDSAGILRDASGWISYLSGTLDPMKGYAANFGNSTDPKTVGISGTVTNGPVSLTLYNHNRMYTKGFNLVGNPYPSPIDWNAESGWTRTNIDNAVYYFDATGEFTGTYSSYINGIGSDPLTNGIISSSQGFFVHVSDGNYPVTGTLAMNNQVRLTDSNPVFHKVAGADIRPLIRLSVGFDWANAKEDPVVIYYDDLATPSFDVEKDALKMFNTDAGVPNLYSVSSDNQPLSIYATRLGSDSISSIPLGLRTLSDGWLLFKTVELKNIPLDEHIYLYDSQTGVYQDLQRTLNYRLYLPAGEYRNRFWLKFSRMDFVGEPITDKGFLAYWSGQDLRIKMVLEPGEIGVLSISDLTGKVISREEVIGVGLTEVRRYLTTGVYLVSLYRPNNVQSQKVFVPSR